MRKLLVTSVSFLLASFPVWADNTRGPVTPSAVTYNILSISLQNDGGTYDSVYTTAFSHTFARSDADFGSVPVANVSLPVGRYLQSNVCFSTTVGILLNGATYNGRTGTALHHGDTLYTTGTDASAPGSVVTSPPAGGAATVNLSLGSSSQFCTGYYLPNPLCVTTDQANCKTGDIVYTASGKIDPKTGKPTMDTAKVSLQINLMVDLFNSALVGADLGNVLVSPGLQTTLGPPGAAIHFTATTGSGSSLGTSDVSVLFGPDKAVLSTNFNSTPDNSVFPQYCNGQGAVYATAGPAGGRPVQKGGPTWIALFDSSGTGNLQSATAGTCTSNDVCGSIGVNTLTQLLQTVGNNASLTCVPDASAVPPSLGYTYTSKSPNGGNGSSVSVNITRIVDPGNIFGTCAASDAHVVTGHSGTCSTVNASTDGYQ